MVKFKATQDLAPEGREVVGLDSPDEERYTKYIEKGNFGNKEKKFLFHGSEI